MKFKVKQLYSQFKGDMTKVTDERMLSELKVKYTGKKGNLTALLTCLRGMPSEKRPEAGRLINGLKKDILNDIHEKAVALKEAEKKRTGDLFDYSLPGRGEPMGTKHPVTLVIEEIREIFEKLGFRTAYGNEIETDYYNFEALNIPKDHPARDMQDTFYVNGNRLLRTHTSPVQIHVMETMKPPLRVIAPGRVYRRDSDITHTPMFHQIEGFMVDRDVSFAHLKGILEVFVHNIFSPKTPLRFRPSYFPFTEPSAEIDIGCVICKGGGCRVCSSTGWLEILGAGMIDPAVFSSVGYDDEEWSGFAFGLGIERIAMLKYNINDIRLFFENDIRFLRQFY